MSDRPAARAVSRRDFLRLRPGEAPRVVEISCRTLFMRCRQAAPLDDPEAVHAHEPWMGEPPPRLHRPASSEVIDALEQELRGAEVLRLVDREWLDGIEEGARLEAVLDAFRARGGTIELPPIS
jgi:hypothetical protein